MAKRQLVAAMVVTSATVAVAANASIGFKFEADHADCLYKVGEEAVVIVTATNGAGEAVKEGLCRVEIDNYGGRNFGVIAKQDFARENPFTLRGTMNEPGFLRVRIQGNDPQGVWMGCQWSVGFDPHRIRPGSERPADFDAFWDAAVAKFAKDVPIDAQMVKNEAESAGTHDCYELTFATVPEGRKIRGQLSIPKGAGRFPITMNVPGAGSGTWSWSRPAGRCYLTLNVLDYPRRPNGDVPLRSDGVLAVGGGCGVDGGDAVATQGGVDALYADQNERWSAKSGLTDDKWYFVGDLSREREDYFYYGAILGINRAVDWVAGLDRIDASDFRYEGQSQGGAFGIILSALNAHLTRAQIGEPALTDLSGELADDRQSGWPQLISRTKGHQALNENVKRIAPYFDCAHFVPRITIPTRWFVGFVDELCPPAAVWAGYNCLRTYDRMMSNFPGLGHGTPAALYRTALQTVEASWSVEVPPPRRAPWIDAKVSEYPEGPLTPRTVADVRGWGNWVGSDFTGKARVAPAGTLEISTEDEGLVYAGSSSKDLSAPKIKGVQVSTSFVRFPSYDCEIGILEVPADAKAALTICRGNFYGLAEKDGTNGWTLLGPAGAYAGAEVAVKIVIEDYTDGDVFVRYLVGATPETVAQIGETLQVKSDAVVSGVSFEGCGALTRLEGDRVKPGMLLLIAGR